MAASFICAYIVQADHYTLDFKCQPDGDIVVQNPDIGLLKSASAGTEISFCNVTKTETTFTISGCNKSTDILFSLSTSEDGGTGDAVLSGSYSETYVIRCQEINDEGIIFNQTMHIGIEANATGVGGGNMTNMSTDAVVYSEVPVTPSFIISSSMWNSGITQQVTTAIVGDLLKWKIQGPYEYDLLPFLCTVNPGSVVGTRPVSAVIQDGCSVLHMVSDFVAASGNASERGSLVSDLYAFKYTMSDELTIACSVKICTRGDAACTVSCGGDRRRRAQTDNHRDLAGSQTTVVSRLIIHDSGAVTFRLSHVLMTFVCIVVLCQSRLYLLM